MTQQKRKNGQKQGPGVDRPGLLGAEAYAHQIVKHLAQVTALSGYGPAVVFADWTQLVHISLEALPDHLRAIARTGRWAEDTPETAEVFARIRARYTNAYASASSPRVWDNFGQAFGLLLESAAPGLWAYARFDGGYMGPDVIGRCYMNFANADPSWSAQYWTPWNVARMMAQMTIMEGEREVHNRLKAALTHPDNILGAAVLLAALTIPEDQPQLYPEWFFARIIPAALPYYEPITFCEPAIGSGVMMLAAASCFPDWAVLMHLVTFSGQDIDQQAVCLAKINEMLYGLNGYALKLAQAVGEVMEAQQSAPHPTSLILPKSPQAALEQAVRLHRQQKSAAQDSAPTFEELFGATAKVDPISV
ncbi:MAG: hypothetical protein BroJett011_43160 [Chloroflexota bacterium]|nr:MAG: hypothetical protein BroJett011_43160 [Chloroflexota bacterium]